MLYLWHVVFSCIFPFAIHLYNLDFLIRENGYSSWDEKKNLTAVARWSRCSRRLVIHGVAGEGMKMTYLMSNPMSLILNIPQMVPIMWNFHEFPSKGAV